MGTSAQQPAIPMPAAASEAAGPDAFAGLWDYNDNESINAATGRPEQVPISATTRRPGTVGSGQVRVRSGPGRGGGEGAGYSRSTGTGYRVLTGTAYMVRKAEDFLRDLLEVPESYWIEVADGVVTFADDLQRQQTYLTDGEQRDYRLSASKFEARVWWEGSTLKREIKGGGGYTMTEAYFLSQDGDQMFVILRMKGNRAGYVAAYNRVYDRIE
jgi:hypothetical protein